MSIFFCVALDIIIYPTAPNQARMLAVSHTKPLHDAVAQMADDLSGATPQSKDALIACQKFCTMQNQQSKQ